MTLYVLVVEFTKLMVIIPVYVLVLGPKPIGKLVCELFQVIELPLVASDTPPLAYPPVSIVVDVPSFTPKLSVTSKLTWTKFNHTTFDVNGIAVNVTLVPLVVSTGVPIAMLAAAVAGT